MHLGATSEILIRVSSTSWAFEVGGAGKAQNRLNARRLQTEQLENNFACTHEQTGTGCVHWRHYVAAGEKWDSGTHRGWMAKASILKSHITHTLVFHGQLTSQVTRDEGEGDRSGSPGEERR